MRLRGKVMLVTGGGDGIGRAVAFAGSSEGARVVVADIDRKSGEETTYGIRARGGLSVFVGADAADELAVKSLIETSTRQFGGIDVLVNNVGIVSRKDILECSVEEWRHVFRVNVESVFLMTKYVMPIMTARGGGSIVNMASIAALVAAPSRPAYCASKGAVAALTRQLALDCAPRKIRVNAVAPSSVEDTGMYQSRPDVQTDPRAVMEKLFSTHPLFSGLNRMCLAADVAQAVIFLVSDEASMITGLTLPVEGGALTSLV